ncbi:MAG TPA: low molecular weight protein-tyrosine-phosphatase [Phycisphaerales bacterium]|nr:low molecular weight protein-tyrosine-phosphatase [Phycisphaerales bacterium]
MSLDQPIRVLMVCTGNICRSPLAECVLRHKAALRGVKERLHIDSAGVGDWHVGEAPDPRIKQVASHHGVTMTGTARQVTLQDLRHFDLLVCMDQTHRAHLCDMGCDHAKARLLLEFDPQACSLDVPDPYYGGIEGFHEVFRIVDRGCECLLDRLLADEGRGHAPRR